MREVTSGLVLDPYQYLRKQTCTGLARSGEGRPMLAFKEVRQAALEKLCAEMTENENKTRKQLHESETPTSPKLDGQVVEMAEEPQVCNVDSGGPDNVRRIEEVRFRIEHGSEGYCRACRDETLRGGQ